MNEKADYAIKFVMKTFLVSNSGLPSFGNMQKIDKGKTGDMTKLYELPLCIAKATVS